LDLAEAQRALFSQPIENALLVLRDGLSLRARGSKWASLYALRDRIPSDGDQRRHQ
jgi:hypothetical protein